MYGAWTTRRTCAPLPVVMVVYGGGGEDWPSAARPDRGALLPLGRLASRMSALPSSAHSVVMRP